MAKLEEVSQVNLHLDTADIIELLGNIELLVDYSSGDPHETVESDLSKSIRVLKSQLSHYYKNNRGNSLTASSTVSISETTL